MKHQIRKLPLNKSILMNLTTLNPYNQTNKLKIFNKHLVKSGQSQKIRINFRNKNAGNQKNKLIQIPKNYMRHSNLNNYKNSRLSNNTIQKIMDLNNKNKAKAN